MDTGLGRSPDASNVTINLVGSGLVFCIAEAFGFQALTYSHRMLAINDLLAFSAGTFSINALPSVAMLIENVQPL